MAGRPILRRQDFKCISPYLYIKSNLKYLTKFVAPTIFQNKFFSWVSFGDFWEAIFENIYGRLLLEKYFSFRDLMIRPQGLLQVSSQLNENSIALSLPPTPPSYPHVVIWLNTNTSLIYRTLLYEYSTKYGISQR